MTAAVAVASFQMLDLSKLEESKLNPRKHFDETKQAELNASVAAKGVLEPILVRPAGKGFEVVAGARRFRAAQDAKLKMVPCMVHELSDHEAFMVAVLENVEREDITALDEGDAYRRLVKDFGQSVERIVQETGRSRTIVFARMKLAELVGPVRELVATGKLSASVGELIARLPTPKSQTEALERLEERVKLSTWHTVGQLPFRDAKEVLDAEFRLFLKSAPWDIKDATLVPNAGACNVCPKRTGADKETFHDVKQDTCLDSACWSKKKSAAFAQLKAEVKETTGNDLHKEKNLFSVRDPGRLTLEMQEKYTKPSEQVLGKRTWKDLLGAIPVPEVVVLDAEQKMHKFVDRQTAMTVLEQMDPATAAKLKEKPADKEAEDLNQRQLAMIRERAVQVAIASHVKRKTLSAVTKSDAVMSLLLAAWAADTYNWEQKLGHAGLPLKTKLSALKPAQRLQLIIGNAFAAHASHQQDVIALAAKLAKVDLKKLTKKAKAAEAGTCFVCGCTKEKLCRKNGVHCIDNWVDHPELTLCTACGVEV